MVGINSNGVDNVGTRPKNNRNNGKRGVAAQVPTQDQIDTAKWLIGRRQYPSKVAVIVAKKYGVSQDFAYRIMDAAREQALQSLAGTGVDPLAGMLLFMESIMGDGTLPIKDRLAACGNMIRMLGMDRLLKKMDVGGNVDAFLAKLMAKQTDAPLEVKA